MKKFGIALLGFGTVGRGTAEILEKKRPLIRKRTGADVEIKHILVRNTEKAIANGADRAIVTDDPELIFNDDDVNIVVECLGGIEPAKTYILRALNSGRHVVTPNKAVVAANFTAFREAAGKNAVSLRFEASVGGGIPVLTSIQEELAANQISEVNGIVNGTTNYILTQMADNDLGYDEALKLAQEKGFAEADPTADVEGIDCANKLSILVALCFDQYIAPSDIPCTGITGVSKDEIAAAKADGARIKLISHAELTDDGKVDCWIRPTRIPESHQLATISNEFNAVKLKGDMVGELMFVGKGAGSLPTGSAVCGDILAVMRENA